MADTYVYRKRIAFHETDSMGVVHHANHVKFYEEARVHWMRARGLIELHIPRGPFVFAVTDLTSQYLRTARFDDDIEVWCEGRTEGAKILFRYAIWCEQTAAWIATGTTTLVPLNEKLVPARIPREARDVFAREPWSETWPPARPAS